VKKGGPNTIREGRFELVHRDPGEERQGESPINTWKKGSIEGVLDQHGKNTSRQKKVLRREKALGGVCCPIRKIAGGRERKLW